MSNRSTAMSLVLVLLTLAHSGVALQVDQQPLRRRHVIRHSIGIAVSGWSAKVAVCNHVGFYDPTRAWAASTISDSILKRFNDPMPTQLPSKKGSPNYPSFLEGLWDVSQTLVGCSAPLGPSFMGGPNGDERIGMASLDEARSRINIPVSLQFRYVQDPSYDAAVIEDRLFNTKQRLDAFAGKSVVASTVYTRDPITNQNTAVLVQFRGPAAQKIFVTGFDGEINAEDGSFCCSERQRSLFALTNANTAPPISTDSELLWQFSPPEDQTVYAKLRIAGYLNPNDRLYFDAKRRAVTLQDYSLVLRRVPSETT